MSAPKKPVSTSTETHLRLFIAVVATLFVGACNVAESMKETQAQAEAAATLLEKEVGTKPLMGWNVHNGTLTNVNVIFDGSKVAALPVSELESKVKRAIAANFKQQPKQLMISARWEQ